MNNVEEDLNKKKIEIDEIKAPDELEEKLREALNSIEIKKPKKKTNYKVAAAAILLILILGYSHDTLAYYGKKIVGYDNISSVSLSNLNNLGMGQNIGKSYKFSDGTIVTLDGVIYDDKYFYVLYSMKNTDKAIDENEAGTNIINIKGLFNNYAMKSGSGKISDDKKQINYVDEFSSPVFYEKKLTFSMLRDVNGKSETGNISFVLDRSKAIKRSFKKNINKSIELDGHKVYFKTISISQLGIEVDGSVDSIFDNIINYDNKIHCDVIFNIIADGKMLESSGESSSGISHFGIGRTFSRNFQGLNSIKKLEIADITFNKTRYYNSSAKSININNDSIDKKIDFDDTSFKIEKMYKEGDSTYVQMLRQKNAEIIGAGFFVDGKEIHSEYKTLDKPNGNEVRDLWRIYGQGNIIECRIKGINFTAEYNGKIDIGVK